MVHFQTRKRSAERSPTQRRVRDVMANQTNYPSADDDVGVALATLNQAGVDELPVH
jgi:hypothetical protein